MKKYCVNGYVFCQGPRVNLTQGADARLVLLDVGGETDFHLPVFTNSLLLTPRAATYTQALVPGSVRVVELTTGAPWPPAAKAARPVCAGGEAAPERALPSAGCVPGLPRMQLSAQSSGAGAPACTCAEATPLLPSPPYTYPTLTPWGCARADNPGLFEFHDNVEEHYLAGMKGVVEVQPKVGVIAPGQLPIWRRARRALA
jgi:hypothetical protein